MIIHVNIRVEKMKYKKVKGPIRKLVINEREHYTITLPKSYMQIMRAKKGDKFKFIYQPKDKQSQNTIIMVRMGCNAV